MLAILLLKKFKLKKNYIFYSFFLAKLYKVVLNYLIYNKNFIVII